MNSIPSELEKFVKKYEANLNTHDIEKATELVSKDAVFWFNDGSFEGLEAIKDAFVKTWENIEDEVYTISNLKFISIESNSAVCIYNFKWCGNVDGQEETSSGRGTNVWHKENGTWKIIHEHLSQNA